ncbi:MAG: hypothetical protein GY856_06450, partial [bacterium]|nr:hypothetical protein [bacterium]
MRKLLKAKSVTLIALLWLGLWGSPGEGQVDPACATWRWVGLKTDPNAPCPPATGWTSTTLSCSPANPPPGLRRFCLYQGGDVNDLLALVPGELQSIEQDCLAVIPAGGEIEQATWSELAEHFHNQAGGMLTDPVSAPVRLALIDTAATRTAAVGSYPGNSAHGYTLANLADNLLCDGDPNCVVDLTAQLALAYLSFDYAVASLSLRDDVDGGYAGTLFDLARAVRCEVEAWEQNPGNPHLVLNLSVAWNGELFGGHETLVDDMPLDVQAVYRAIGDAVCRGVVVVAAAGNVTGGP